MTTKSTFGDRIAKRNAKTFPRLILKILAVLVLAAVGAAGVWMHLRPGMEKAQRLLDNGDAPAALGMFLRVAAAGDGAAAAKVGAMRFRGQGTPVDPGGALPYLATAAASGDAPSRVFLATIYHDGLLGKVDAGGGGTIAKVVANRNVEVVDIGVPVLSMHAPFELTAKLDVYSTWQAFSAFAGEKAFV